MKPLTYFICLIGIGLLSSTSLFGQLSFPVPSPYSKVTQLVGYTTIGVEYSRPSMRKRTIFGELVPFGEVWRSGANASTKISFNSDVTIEGKELPHGTYSLLTIPREDSWTLIFNNDLELRGTNSYDIGKDELRVEVPVQNIDCHFETFLIDIGELTQNTATVQMIWENTIVKFNVGTYTDKEVMAKIDNALKDPMVALGNTYYSSANYYLERHKDMKKAQEWINKAIEINGESPNYLLLKARIIAESNDYRQAISTAKKAKQLAMNSTNNSSILKAIDSAIEKWKAIKPN